MVYCARKALDGVVDTDVDYTSNDAGSSPTIQATYSFLPFSFFSQLRRAERKVRED